MNSKIEASKNDLIKEIEMIEKLDQAGIVQFKKEEFLESIVHENRSIGFFGTGDELKVFCIGEAKMESLDMKYKSLLDDFPEITWRRQNIGEDMEIGPEQNGELFEKYESLQTKKAMTLEQDTRKTNRSYKKL